MECAGSVEVALSVQDIGEVMKAIGGIRVVGAQTRLVDGHGTFEEGAGGGQVTLGLQDVGEVVEAGSGGGVVGAQVGLVDRQGTRQQAAGLLVVGALPQVQAGLGEQPSGGLRLNGERLGVAGYGQDVW
jgi:hypothetical protein